MPEDRISKLTPEMQKALSIVLGAMESKFPKQEYTVAQGLRTIPEQNALFEKGSHVTKARGGRSYHNYGLAADIYPMVDNKIADYNQAKDWYDYYGQQATDAGMTWGGSPGYAVPGDYGHINLDVPAPWAKKKLSAFGEAFDKARKAGLETFTFDKDDGRGPQLYSTEMKDIDYGPPIGSVF